MKNNNVNSLQTVNVYGQPEQWRSVTIPGFDCDYQVSQFGRIKSLQRASRGEKSRRLTDRILPGKVRHDGYMVVNLTSEKGQRSFAVHRLVAMAFIKNPRQAPEVNHKDGNKLNNHVSNLEWVTHQENILHAISIGLNQSQGANNKQFKGAITATHITTGEMKTFIGKKALKSAGFESGSVYAVIKGRRKTHKGYLFAREPLISGVTQC